MLVPPLISYVTLSQLLPSSVLWFSALCCRNNWWCLSSRVDGMTYDEACALKCPVYIGCWSHQTQSSRVKPLNLILLFSNQLLSVFRLPQSFFKWMAACQMALFHPLHLLSLEDCWIGSDKLWLLCVATTWHALLKSAFACACVCVCTCTRARRLIKCQWVLVLL